MITIDFECALFLTHERTLHCHAVVPLHSGRVVGNPYLIGLRKSSPSERSRWRGGRCRVGDAGILDFQLS
jgi:hypothetical protein